MPTFERCANCGELRIEHYGTVTEDECVECAALERQALTNAPATASRSSQQENSIVRADYPDVDHRRQVRIMTLIKGHIEDQNGPHEFKILDVSRTGAKLQTTQELPNGTITLAFPGVGTLRATSAWRDGPTRGVTFIDPRNEVIAVVGKAMPYLGPMLRVA